MVVACVDVLGNRYVNMSVIGRRVRRYGERLVVNPHFRRGSLHRVEFAVGGGSAVAVMLEVVVHLDVEVAQLDIVGEQGVEMYRLATVEAVALHWRRRQRVGYDRVSDVLAVRVAARGKRNEH